MKADSIARFEQWGGRDFGIVKILAKIVASSRAVLEQNNERTRAPQTDANALKLWPILKGFCSQITTAMTKEGYQNTSNYFSLPKKTFYNNNNNMSSKTINIQRITEASCTRTSSMWRHTLREMFTFPRKV